MGAPKVIGDAADTERMHFLQQEIEKALLPYRENTEAAIAILALIRVTRILLRQYPPPVQEEMFKAIGAYLAGKGTMGEGAAREPSALERLGFVVPPGSRVN